MKNEIVLPRMIEGAKRVGFIRPSRLKNHDDSSAFVIDYTDQRSGFLKVYEYVTISDRIGALVFVESLPSFSTYDVDYINDHKISNVVVVNKGVPKNIDELCSNLEISHYSSLNEHLSLITSAITCTLMIDMDEYRRVTSKWEKKVVKLEESMVNFATRIAFIGPATLQDDYGRMTPFVVEFWGTERIPSIYQFTRVEPGTATLVFAKELTNKLPTFSQLLTYINMMNTSPVIMILNEKGIPKVLYKLCSMQEISEDEDLAMDYAILTEAVLCKFKMGAEEYNGITLKSNEEDAEPEAENNETIHETDDEKDEEQDEKPIYSAVQACEDSKRTELQEYMRKIKKASAKGCVETKILSCSETLINQRDVLDLSNAGYNITIYKVDDHNFTCSVTWILIHEGKAGHIRYYGFTKEEMDEIKMYYYGRKRTVLDYAMVDGSVSHNCLSIL